MTLYNIIIFDLFHKNERSKLLPQSLLINKDRSTVRNFPYVTKQWKRVRMRARKTKKKEVQCG